MSRRSDWDRIEIHAKRIAAPMQVCAKVCGVSNSQARTYNVTPLEDSPTMYWLDDVVAARIEAQRRRLLGQDADDEEGAETIAAYKKRQEKAKAEKLEIQVGRLRGELVDASGVRKAFERSFASFKTRLLAMPSALAPHLVDRERDQIEREIETELRRALDDLSRLDAAKEAHEGAADDEEVDE